MNRATMIAASRHGQQVILRQLKRRGPLRVEDLLTYGRGSTEGKRRHTVRQDLNQLKRMGLAEKAGSGVEATWTAVE